MKRILFFLALSFLVVDCVPVVSATNFGVYTCDGTDGAITRSGATNENRAIEATTYVVDPSVTVTYSVTDTGDTVFYICAQTSITINGTIDVSGKGNLGGTDTGGNPASGGVGSVRRGGGFGTIGGAGGALGARAGGFIYESMQQDYPDSSALGAGGGSGRVGTAVTAGSGGGGGALAENGGAGGAAGASVAATGARGIGGNGGGIIVLVSPIITFASTCTINVNGANGGAGTQNSGGGGAGSGGAVYVTAQTFTDNGCTITGTGGTGGACQNGAGGAGGTFGLVGSVGASPVNGGGCGGGGSGGLYMKRIGGAGADGTSGTSGTSGVTGARGRDAGYLYRFNSQTACPTDPGANGNFEFDLQLPSTDFPTAFCIRETDGDGNNQAPWIATWDDSTSTIKGQLLIVADPITFGSGFLTFQVTGTMTDHGTWDSFSVTYVAGTATWANNQLVKIFFFPTGDKGATGTAGTSGTSGTSGSSGTSGTSGVSGSSGTSGTSGLSGSSGTSGTSGINGASGTSGTSGTSGLSGTSGTSGNSALVNVTARLLFGPVEENVPILVYARVEDTLQPVNATTNLTIQISRVVNGTVWTHEVTQGVMTKEGADAGLYVYSWNATATERYNIRVNGTTTNGSFAINDPVRVTSQGVLTETSLVELPGLSNANAFLLLACVVLAFLALTRKWWFIAGISTVGGLSVLTPTDFTLPVIVVLILLGAWLEVWVANRRKKAADEAEAQVG